MRPLRSTFPPAALLAVTLAACGSGAALAASARDVPPGPDARIDPADFVARVDNPWFPLRPGTVLRYRGSKDGRAAVEVFRVTRRTKTILGVVTTVVDDRMYLDGRLHERTLDWYAQDRAGTVWYFGEDTAALDRSGMVTSREGSFTAGVDGASLGIYMPARPKVGQTFQQEYYTGHAEDQFTVADLAAPVSVPGARSRRSLRTTERTRLEPGVVDAKYYVRGIGTVREVQLAGPGPRERLELVSVRRG